MKTLTISDTGNIVRGIRAVEAEEGGWFIKIHRNSHPKNITRVYLKHGDSPEIIGGVVYEADFDATGGFWVLTKPKGIPEFENLFLILLQGASFWNQKGIVQKIYGKKGDLDYMLIVAKQGAEFEIQDPEDENRWIRIKIIEP